MAAMHLDDAKMTLPETAELPGVVFNFGWPA